MDLLTLLHACQLAQLGYVTSCYVYRNMQRQQQSSCRLFADSLLLCTQDWEAKEKRMQEAGAKWGEEGAPGEGEGSDDEDELPFACYICRRPWDEVPDPVVTRCKHYFCEHCALKHNARSKKCAACEQPTNGIFNVAKDVIKRTKDKKAAAAET